MEDADLKALTTKLEQLIQRIEQLKAQNHLLLANERAWREERAHLIEKNEMARLKVESMISRLKGSQAESLLSGCCLLAEPWPERPALFLGATTTVSWLCLSFSMSMRLPP